jgi:hypothetical protein
MTLSYKLIRLKLVACALYGNYFSKGDIKPFYGLAVFAGFDITKAQIQNYTYENIYKII